jgi:hypothetical protein
LGSLDASRSSPGHLVWTLCAACLGGLWSSQAAAEPPPERAETAPSPASPAGLYGPLHSASVSFFSFFGPGVTMEYERFALPPGLSFVSALGFRSTGGDDYTTATVTTSLEARLWLGNVVPWRGPDRRTMVGPLLSLRADVAWTSVNDDTRGRLAGTAVELAETLGLGYRLTLWRLHATPILGATVTTQTDPRGRLAPITFLSGKLAVTLGVMF